MNIENMSTNEILTRLFIAWGLTPLEKQTFIDESEKDFISQIIYRRTMSFDIKLPTDLAYIISLCSMGNPGIAIVMYHNILKGIKDTNGPIPKGYVITISDFSRTYGSSFPNTEISTEREKMEKLWDAQKDERGNNKVDTIEYWSDLFEKQG